MDQNFSGTRILRGPNVVSRGPGLVNEIPCTCIFTRLKVKIPSSFDPKVYPNLRMFINCIELSTSHQSHLFLKVWNIYP